MEWIDGWPLDEWLDSFNLDAVLFQRARIYLYQSQLACRTHDRTKAARLISRALRVINYRHVMRRDDMTRALLTARVMHQARSLSDLPEVQWNEARERLLGDVLKRFDAIEEQLTPQQQRDFELLTEND